MSNSTATNDVALSPEYVAEFIDAVKFTQDELINKQIASLVTHFNTTEAAIKKLQQEQQAKTSSSIQQVIHNSNYEMLELANLSKEQNSVSEPLVSQDLSIEEKRLEALKNKIQGLVNTSTQLQLIVASIPATLAPDAAAELAIQQQNEFNNLPSGIVKPTASSIAKISTVGELKTSLKTLDQDTHYEHTGVLGKILDFINRILHIKLSVATATEKTIHKTSSFLWRTANTLPNNVSESTTLDSFLDIMGLVGSAIVSASHAIASGYTAYSSSLPIYGPQIYRSFVTP